MLVQCCHALSSFYLSVMPCLVNSFFILLPLSCLPWLLSAVSLPVAHPLVILWVFIVCVTLWSLSRPIVMPVCSLVFYSGLSLNMLNSQQYSFIHSFHFTILSSAFGSATCLLYSTTWYTWYLTAVNTFNEVSLRAQYNQIHHKVYFVKHGTHYSLKRTIKKCTL